MPDSKPTQETRDRTPYLCVSRSRSDGGLQISVDNASHGFRIAGPKFDGSSELLMRHRLTRDDVRAMLDFLDEEETAHV